jgi:hypothetical protein
MVAVETKKFTANLVATRQEIVNPGLQNHAVTRNFGPGKNAGAPKLALLV